MSKAQVERWSNEDAGLHVFSTLVFSHAFHNGKRVFALGNPAGGVEVWDASTQQSTTWMPQ
ncbi:hypothetical protein JQ628_11335 [Bradyrhizobium lablabi]|uniref:hypothetical protein n=1 Tax=Bradyrhizobium lablabi TaxID=722472 RepID=UPI001BAD2D89|nr:hypothetical protein [Bradyrhizobium lablabi]MBR1122109.1 hypothetical protein [Bradyrhizobium lablabi]